MKAPLPLSLTFIRSCRKDEWASVFQGRNYEVREEVLLIQPEIQQYPSFYGALGIENNNADADRIAGSLLTMSREQRKCFMEANFD